MRSSLLLILLAATVLGCTQRDTNIQWDPKAKYPAWTYDKPFYYRPTEELAAAETIGSDIPVFYTNRGHFFVRHPGGYQLSGVPRVGLYYSTDDGAKWARTGYFGVEQTHFLFTAEADGRYWIRFLGPGQGVTKSPPGVPHRIYVVDRRPPEISIYISPAPWTDTGRQTRRVYRPGQEIEIQWTVSDPDLEAGSVRLATSFGEFPHNVTWRELGWAMGSSGSRKVAISPEAAGRGGMRLRVEATDKAGNVGLAVSPTLFVAGKDGPTTRPATLGPTPIKAPE